MSNGMVDGVMLGAAVTARRSAQSWEAYAHELEKLLSQSQQHVAGLEALKNAAIGELAKVDPRNYLTVREHRQRVFEAGMNSTSGRRAA